MLSEAFIAGQVKPTHGEPLMDPPCSIRFTQSVCDRLKSIPEPRANIVRRAVDEYLARLDNPNLVVQGISDDDPLIQPKFNAKKLDVRINLEMMNALPVHGDERNDFIRRAIAMAIRQRANI